MSKKINTSKKMVFYFYSPNWDDMNYKKKNDFMDECRRVNIRCEPIDVDTENGAAFSCKLNVKNVPTAVFVANGKVIGVEKGNLAHTQIAKYI